MQRLDQFLQKMMPLITPTGVIIGIIFSGWLNPFIFLVSWIFAFMTFTGSLGSNFIDLKNVVRHPFSLFVCLIILHIIMPLIALGVGNLTFHDDPLTTTGLILSFVIPTGITSLIWVSIYKGNVILTLSIVLLDTLLAPFVVPFILQLLVGTAIEIDGLRIMKGLLWMIVLPSILGMLLNQWTDGSIKNTLGKKLSPFSKIGLGIVVALNSSGVAPFFKDFNMHLVSIAAVVFVLAALGYLIGWIVAKALKQPSDTVVSLTYNSGMRNISTGAVIAITYFPASVALPVVVGMLFQQILAAITGSLLTHINKSKKAEGYGTTG